MMERLPEFLINKIYKYKHEMLYSKVMRQVKAYRLNIVFIVSLEFLECGYYEFGGVRTMSIDINNINATPQEVLCVISNNSDTRTYRWARPYGGLL